MAEPARRPVTDQFHVGFYVIGMIDILNQRQQLARWANLPPDETVDEEMIAGIRASVGVVNDLRAALIAGVEGLRSSRPAESVLRQLTPQDAVQFEKWGAVRSKLQVFADSMLLFAPVQRDDMGIYIKDLAAILLGLGMVFPAFLANGIVIRGAVQYGAACDAFLDQVYGPCLASVHQLESEIAEYPRIVVGRELVQLLDELRTCTGGSPIRQAMRQTASLLRSVIFDDDDGVLVLDYLAEPILAIARKSQASAFDSLLPKADAFVESEYRRFLREGDRKLALRYARMRGYWRSRMRRENG